MLFLPGKFSVLKSLQHMMNSPALYTSVEASQKCPANDEGSSTLKSPPGDHIVPFFDTMVGLPLESSAYLRPGWVY